MKIGDTARSVALAAAMAALGFTVFAAFPGEAEIAGPALDAAALSGGAPVPGWSLPENGPVPEGSIVDLPLAATESCRDIFASGPCINSPGTGPGKADESILQNATLGMASVGYNCNWAAMSWIADDFIVSEPGMDVDQVLLYAYQTGSTTASTINGVTYQVWDGPPNSGTSRVIFGDLVTDRMTDTVWSNAYRRLETTPGSTNRPIMVQTCDAGFHLAPGTYWIQFGALGTLSSGPWQPPVAILGTAVTGNAMKYVSGFWRPLLDDSAGAPAQGVPFNLRWCCPTVTVLPTGPLAGGAAGVPYPAVTFAPATSNPVHQYDAFSWSLSTGSLPDGLTLDPATGVLSGTPTLDGTYNFTVRAAVSASDTCYGETSCTIAIGSASLPGDCDGDGSVGIGELQKAISMFLGTQSAACGADCDGDGQVSIGEVQKVINAYLGVATSC